jgi:hypothetical protein
MMAWFEDLPLCMRISMCAYVCAVLWVIENKLGDEVFNPRQSKRGMV